MSEGSAVRTDEENENELVRSKALRGAIAGTWLGTTIAVAVCAATFQLSYPPNFALAATALALIVSVLVVAGRAARVEGCWGSVLAAVAATGALPSFISVCLYGVQRPLILMPCDDCGPSYETILSVGAGIALLPLVASSVAASLIAKRRHRPIPRLLPVVSTFGLLLATAVAGVAASRAISFVSGDRYLDTVPEEVARVAGTTLVVGDDTEPNSTSVEPLTTSGSLPPQWNTQWRWNRRGGPCEFSLGNLSRDLPAAKVRASTVPGKDREIVCPALRIRRDVPREIVIVDEVLSNGGFRPAVSMRLKDGVTGPLYVNGDDLPRVAPARVWVISAVSGVLAALALVCVRLLSERRLRARWRKAPIATHRGDGWVAFEDGAPHHLPSARDLPPGDVHVLGMESGAKGGYRSSTAALSSEAVAGQLTTIEREAHERAATTLIVAGLIAVIAATPVASALFVMSL